ncbi:MAG: LppP/LprE family lipoprotein, partial [Nitrososphaera sp.]|nr:LppP/LprE family lipoprotein [Nitrososphaera sp.]
MKLILRLAKVSATMLSVVLSASVDADFLPPFVVQETIGAPLYNAVIKDAKENNIEPDFEPLTIVRPDLDRDGTEDIALIYGGSNSSENSYEEYLIVELNGSKEIVGPHLLGTRTTRQIKTTPELGGFRMGGVRIGNGSLIVEFLEIGPDDANCCPSVRSTRVFKIEGNEIVERDLNSVDENKTVMASVGPATKSDEVKAIARDNTSVNLVCSVSSRVGPRGLLGISIDRSSNHAIIHPDKGA